MFNINPLLLTLLIPLFSIVIFGIVNRLSLNIEIKIYSGIKMRIEYLISLITALIVLIMSLWIASQGVGKTGYFMLAEYTWIEGFISLTLATDVFSSVMLILSGVLVFSAVFASIGYIKEEHTKYNTLMMLFLTGIIGVFTSFNLFFFYLFWELVLIPMFFFILKWGGPNRNYAAYKFFIYTHAGSLLMLVGFMVLYSYTSTFNSFEIALGIKNGIVPATMILPIFLAFFAGFAVKVPLVPFHTWLPDAHVEAPGPISVLLAGLLLKMGGYGFLRFTPLFFDSILPNIQIPLIILGLITAIYGALVAGTQKDLKRLIALTSVSHMGFVIVGLGAMNQLSIGGSIFQMVSHGMISGTFFIISGIIPLVAGSRLIPELNGLGSKKFTSFLLIFTALAGFGLPGLSGFVGEYMIIAGSIKIWSISALIVIAPAVVAAYMVWMIYKTVFTQGDVKGTHEDSLYLLLPAILLAILILFLGLYPSIILEYLQPYIGQFG